MLRITHHQGNLSKYLTALCLIGSIQKRCALRRYSEPSLVLSSCHCVMSLMQKCWGNSNHWNPIQITAWVSFIPGHSFRENRYEKGCGFFAYSWKLPAYSGAFYLQLTILAFLLTIGAFLLTVLASLLTVGAFLLTVGAFAPNKGLEGL